MKRLTSTAAHSVVAALFAVWIVAFDGPLDDVTTNIELATLSVTALSTEYATNPVGIDAMRPRLGWQIRSSDRGVVQTAYEIQLATSEEVLRRGRDLSWNTGKVSSDQSVHVAYDGPALESGVRYYWRVRVWDNDQRESTWSDVASFEMGLLKATDWQANWIRPTTVEDSTKPPPVPMLRGEFALDDRIASARLYVTSLGLNEVFLNGQRVGDRLFTPGWTSYNKRLQYDTYDVTNQLQGGANVIGVVLAEGWYRGRLGWEYAKDIYGSQFGLLAQLVIHYADGSSQTVGSGADWKAATGPIVSSVIYDGEVYDARLERDGWSEPGYDDADWSAAAEFEHPKDILVAPAGPPVRRIEELKPVAMFQTPAGETVLDMGQNMVGWIRLRVDGPRGTVVTVKHAEVLDSDGNFYTTNLRAAKAEISYTLSGDGEEVYEPHFTFMGFRYVAVEGYPGTLTTDDITGIVVHSDITPTGTFETSNEMLNQLQHNIVWGQKGNFLDVPTDTPARDERLGWTGDAQAFAPTAAFNFDVAGFFTKWFADVAADQKPDGSVPWVVPDVLDKPDQRYVGAAGWGDIATIGPWAMYLAYGDTLLLDRQYDSMKRWVDYIHGEAGDDLIWSETFTFGDWLAYNTPAADYPGATTDKDLIATAFFAHSTNLVSRAATILGKEADARMYRDLFEQIKEAFRREYVTNTGRISSNTQTAYALALEFDLLTDAQRDPAGERLAADVTRFGHLTTGFLGTPHLAPALQHTGNTDLAYQLLLREDYPSWLYPISRGATTMWERWDGIKPDGTFQDIGMNSFNHYAYGAIGDWMYRVVAGLALDPDEPGYKHVLIEPEPGGDLTFAQASLKTMYGETAAGWERTTDGLRLTVVIPPNTHGTIRLPGAKLATVREGNKPVANATGIRSALQTDSTVIVEVGSGTYVFDFSSER